MCPSTVSSVRWYRATLESRSELFLQSWSPQTDEIRGVHESVLGIGSITLWTRWLTRRVTLQLQRRSEVRLTVSVSIRQRISYVVTVSLPTHSHDPQSHTHLERNHIIRLLWMNWHFWRFNSNQMNFLHYESIKREVQTRPLNKCRYDERLKTKAEESIRLTYTGLHGELEHLKIKKFVYYESMKRKLI